MKCVKIDTNKYTVNQYDPTINIRDHSIIGLLKSKKGDTASIYNILTVDSETEQFIGLKTEYILDETDDVTYVDNSDLNLKNMDKDVKDKVFDIFKAVDEKDMWYSDLDPIKWEDDKITVQAYHNIDNIHIECDIVLPLGTYLFLSKVKSDMITYVLTNPYYTFTDAENFKYSLKHLDNIEYLGSEYAGEEEDGNHKVLSMYHAYGDDVDQFMTIPFSTDHNVTITKNLSLKEFTDSHDSFFNFDLTTFFYYSDPREDAIEPAIIVYNSEEKEYDIFKLGPKVFDTMFRPDKEVSKDETNSEE